MTVSSHRAEYSGAGGQHTRCTWSKEGVDFVILSLNSNRVDLKWPKGMDHSVDWNRRISSKQDSGYPDCGGWDVTTHPDIENNSIARSGTDVTHELGTVLGLDYPGIEDRSSCIKDVLICCWSSSLILPYTRLSRHTLLKVNFCEYSETLWEKLRPSRYTCADFPSLLIENQMWKGLI